MFGSVGERFGVRSIVSMKGGGGKEGRGGIGGSSAKNNTVPSNSPTRNTANDHITTSPAGDDIAPLEDSNNPNNSAVDDGSTYTNPSSITSRDMATMSGFMPTTATTADGTAERTSSAALFGTITSSSSAGVQSMPGAYAVPGINSTTTSSSAPMTTGAEGNIPGTSDQQIRRLSSRTGSAPSHPSGAAGCSRRW